MILSMVSNVYVTVSKKIAPYEFIKCNNTFIIMSFVSKLAVFLDIKLVVSCTKCQLESVPLKIIFFLKFLIHIHI